jgi:hypothetical protein
VRTILIDNLTANDYQSQYQLNNFHQSKEDKNMKTKVAAGVFAAVLSASFSSAAGASNSQNGVNGWDNPNASEFVIKNVHTHFTTGEAPVYRDVHIDCDLLVKDGDKRHYTTGFAMQFNAETDNTERAIGAKALKNLKKWRGQLDYRGGKVKGTIVHLESAHKISRNTVKAAKQKCMSEHNDHGTDINAIGNMEGKHPEYL